MSNYTTPAGIFDNVTDYLPPILPETPLYQGIFREFGTRVVHIFNLHRFLATLVSV